ncbi:MAG: cytidine deaminase [Acidimicrobiaceae bacterium]|nr:cytidine deaminase [Acidimicrobiia bacterium]MCY4493139.1 cytidine deaminase [Acidimicrobiaceae bacterium]
MTDIDLAELRQLAIAQLAQSYSPYSNFPVGAAGIADDGRTVVGTNVENASYGLTLCAECSMVSDLVRTGGGRLLAVSTVQGDETPVAPCGRCRQLLFEHGGGGLIVDWDPEPLLLDALIPEAFGPSNLA